MLPHAPAKANSPFEEPSVVPSLKVKNKKNIKKTHKKTEAEFRYFKTAENAFTHNQEMGFILGQS